MKRFVAGTIVVLAASPLAAAPTETVIYSMMPGSKGSGVNPEAGLAANSSGELFGTGAAGGRSDVGAIFRLTPPAKGKSTWKAETIFSFGGKSGGGPATTLAIDSAGNLYGTMFNSSTVFRVSPPAAGKKAWLFKTIAVVGGALPTPLLVDAKGNLYGATNTGGTGLAGAIYQLVRPSSIGGKWKQRILYSCQGSPDCVSPNALSLIDANGNIFGSAEQGGTNNNGVFYELTPPPKGQTAWLETILYSFPAANMNVGPVGPMVVDLAGDFYGVLVNAGPDLQGEVFELLPPANGGSGWSEKILHSFGSQGDGSRLNDALIVDKSGNVYGTTADGGAYGDGIAYELSPPAAGKTLWSETILHHFGNPDQDATNPVPGLIADSQFNLYGAATYGGSHFDGSVFKPTP